MKTAVYIAAVFLGFVLSCDANDSALKPQEELLPQAANGNFVLYVSNQSRDVSPVDITIRIDGKLVVSADFAVGDAHNWVRHTFQLSPGKHKITAVSRKGEARMEKEIEIKDKHWAVIQYFFREGVSKQFTFEIQDKPMAFA